MPIPFSKNKESKKKYCIKVEKQKYQILKAVRQKIVFCVGGLVSYSDCAEYM